MQLDSSGMRDFPIEGRGRPITLLRGRAQRNIYRTEPCSASSMARSSAEGVDAYIAGFPRDIQRILTTVRRAIRSAAPHAEETMSYQIPAYRFHGWLMYFAAFKNHYSVFGATDQFVDQFKKELAAYEVGKGTIRFSFDKPVPVALIKKIAKFRAKENLEREKSKIGARAKKKVVEKKSSKKAGKRKRGAQ